MKRKKDESNEYSFEVHQIMGTPPSKLIRHGAIIIFFILMMVVIGGLYLKYPNIISVPVILTTENPPIPVVSQRGGKIEELFVREGTYLTSGESIAVLENPSNYEDICILEKYLDNFSGEWKSHINQVFISKRLNLGELQNHFISFQKELESLRQYLKSDFLSKKIDLTKDIIAHYAKYLNQIQQQKKVNDSQFQLAIKKFERDSSYYFAKKYGITLKDYEGSIEEFLVRKSENIAFNASIENLNTTLLKLRAELLDLEIAKRKDLQQYSNNLDELKLLLINQIDLWKEKYLLESPINGEITFTKYWSENQFIKPGERLAAIVPTDNSQIIGKTFVKSEGMGDLQLGQRVNIKISSFPYMEHGYLVGEISKISLVPEDEGYAIDIHLKNMISTNNERFEFTQEMEGVAEIVVSNSRIISRLMTQY